MSPSHSPRLDAELERIARERLAAEREAGRAYRRELVRVALECIGSALAGLVCMAFGLHTTNNANGAIAWWGGMLLGYTGIALSLITAYLRGEARGDW